MKHRKAVAKGLADLRAQYLNDWANLGYYATDKQRIDGLVKIKTGAARLRDALQESKAVRYELYIELLDISPSASVSRSESKKISAGLDRNVAAVDAIHQLACGALNRVGKQAKRRPGSTAKPSALKPHDIDLARGIQRLWRDLGRSAKGRDGLARAEFAARIFEYIWQVEEVHGERVDDLFERAENTFGKV